MNLAQQQRIFKKQLTDKKDTRLSSYQKSIRVRFLNSLREDFTLTCQALEDQSDVILMEYLDKRPSRRQNLAEVSLGFHSFLIEKKIDFRICEVARFEELKILSENSSTNEPAEPLSQMADYDLTQIALVFDSSVQLFQSSFNVRSWPSEETNTFLLLHGEYELRVEELTEMHFEILTQLKSGKTLTELRVENADLEEITHFFSNWTSNKVIIGFRPL